MNPGQLGVLFAQHKTAILGAGAAGAVLLGLRARKKGTAGPVTSQTAGTLPAAAVVPSDQLAAAASGISSTDAYALQDELSKFIAQQQQSVTGQSGITSVPPVASTLFAPTGTGQYAQYGNGTVAEIESDGSQLGLTYGQWNDLLSKGNRVTQVLPVGAPASDTAYYETGGNLATVKKPS